MKTPAGKECKFFYGDYYRGRHHEECRLLKDHGLSWIPSMCQDCPVPGILLANSCEHLQFTPTINKPLFFMKPKVKVKAFCTKSNSVVEEPKIGCSECHPGLQNLIVLPDDPDNSPD
jgi:hypothetical protein